MTSGGDSILARRWWAPTATIVGMIALTSYNILAVVAALPQITGELGDVALLAWVITGFLLTSTVATVVAGPLVDVLGVRMLFRVTMVTFVAASAACAAAPTMLLLVVFRSVQGVAAGLSFTVATAAVGIVYPERLRPRALAALSVTWGVMALGGPTVAASFVATTGWRGIFLVNIPVGAAAAALGWFRLPPPTKREAARQAMDGRGIVLLAAFTTVGLAGFSAVSVAAGVAVVGAGVLAVGYWVHSGRVRAPVLARRYFARYPIGTANLAFGLAVGAALGIDAYLPVYVTAGLGRSVVTAAFSVAFLTVGWTVASVTLTRVLDRYTETPVALVGFATILAPLAVGLATFDAATPVALVFAVAFVLGVGVGTVSMTILNLLYLVSSPGEVGRSTAAHTYARGLFQTYATAIVGAIILLIVGERVGDVELVREILAGDRSVADAATRDAVALGFRLGHGIALAFTATGIGIAVWLHRRLGVPFRRERSEQL